MEMALARPPLLMSTSSSSETPFVKPSLCPPVSHPFVYVISKRRGQGELRAGTKSGSILLTILALVSRTARLRDQLQLGDEVNSIIADGGPTGSRLPGGTSVSDLPTSSVSAERGVQLVPQ